MSLPSPRRSRLLFWNALGAAALSWLWACGPSLSQIPLFNALPEGPGEYLYGPEQLAKLGGARDAKGPSDSEPAGKHGVSDPKGQDNAARKRREKEESAGKRARTSNPAASGSTALSENDAGVEAAPPKTALIVTGDYVGTDRVAIRLGGETATEEVDPKARVRVEASEDSVGDYVVSVLDSNTGDTLCGLTGSADGNTIHFELDQLCFEGTLGIDATTSLKSGEARISGSSLTVTFEVALVAFDDDGDDGDDGNDDDDDDDDGENKASGAIEVGTVKYRFDGKRQ